QLRGPSGLVPRLRPPLGRARHCAPPHAAGRDPCLARSPRTGLPRFRGAAMKRCLVAIILLALIAGAGARVSVAASPAQNPEPMLAYYYIWYDHASWRRAKTDYPLLGRYSSDDVRVLRKHVRWAEQAGITGFIVSWKSTRTRNRTSAELATGARSE